MPILFSSKTPEYAWLSNFSPPGFELEGVKWRTVEHYYQAQKFAGTPLARKVYEMPNGPAARKCAHGHDAEIRADWETVKEEVMRRAVAAKFSQNRKLRKDLLATGDEPLWHFSTKDFYWGCGPDGVGENRLGLMIMEVRAALRTQPSP